MSQGQTCGDCQSSNNADFVMHMLLGIVVLEGLSPLQAWIEKV